MNFNGIQTYLSVLKICKLIPYHQMCVLLDMDARLIAVMVCAWAVCHVTQAQLPTPTTLQV